MFPLKRVNDLIMTLMPWRQKKRLLMVKLPPNNEPPPAVESKEVQTGAVQQVFDDNSANQHLTDVVYGTALTPAPAAEWESSRRCADWDGHRAEEGFVKKTIRQTRGFQPLTPPTAVTSVFPSDADRLIKSTRDFRVIYTEDPWVRMQMDKLRRSLVGMCEHCKEAIYNEGIRGLGGRLYHPHHFSCSSCFMMFGIDKECGEDEIQDVHEATFYERNGQAFCTGCYLTSFAPKCQVCSAPVGNDRGGAIAALGGVYHAACFECNSCKASIGDAEVFMEHEGKPYCRSCFLEELSPKCSECSTSIADRYVVAFDQTYHRECFRCVECCDDGSSLAFDRSNARHFSNYDEEGLYYFAHEGKPYCKFHYEEKVGRKCCHCGRQIVGRCMAAMSRQFEEEQFICAFCQRYLTAARYYEISVPQAIIRCTKKDQWTRANCAQEY